MSRFEPRTRTWLAGAAATAVVAGSLMAAAGPAAGADRGQRSVPIGIAAYQYGNWAQPGAGFRTGADDTLSQVYQLISRSSFPDLDDTPGPVYAAGTFITSGSTTINRVGQWNGTAWVPLTGDDTGIGFGVGQSLAMGSSSSAGFALPGVFGLVLGGDDSLYAGGSFVASDDTLNNVGKWNGSDWIRMGNGLTAGTSGTSTVNDIVQDMVMGNDFIGMDDTNYADDTVYAIGGFGGICSNIDCSSSPVSARGIAQYSQADDTWYPMGDGTLTGGDRLIFAGAYLDDTLYVGGSFDTISGVSATRIAQWQQSTATWLSLGAGLNNGIFSMAVHPITKDLYVGGTFTAEVGGAANSLVGVAKWDYTDDTWYPVGTGLSSPNVDDISFSADGKTMWIGNWDIAPRFGTTWGNGIATLTSDDFISDGAQAIGGSWNYLKSAGIIGVSGPSNSSINQRSVRAVLALAEGSAMFGGNFATAGAVNAGRVGIFTVGPEPSPYDPVYPPGAPTNVVATGGWNKVDVTWTAPTNTGSYPITNYLVQASPGGKVCITRTIDVSPTACTFTSLTPGTRYTFTVQGLNGGGWGERSAASNAASPQNLKVTGYSRKKRSFIVGGGSQMVVSGIAPGFARGTAISAWTKVGDGDWRESGRAAAVDSSARFSWKRNWARKLNGQSILVRFSIGENFSNTVRIGRVR